VELAQNYPNPFNSTTSISYTLHRSSAVRLTIYNLLGRVVRRWETETLPPGTYSVAWDGTSASGPVAASGIYFYRLEAAGRQHTRKMVLLK
jgi:flagellar hook assembly protein FlgD